MKKFDINIFKQKKLYNINKKKRWTERERERKTYTRTHKDIFKFGH